MDAELDQQRIYGDERRHKELIAAITRLQLLIEESVEEPLIPLVNVAPPDLSSLVFPEPFVFDPEAIANALARRLPPDQTEEVAQALQATVKQLERLNKKVTALSTMPSGGSSGHVIVDSGIITSINQPIEIANDLGNPIPVSSPTLATQATLASLLAVALPTEPITANGTAIAGGALTVTLPAVAGKTNYITRFTLTASQAASPISVDVTLVGVIGGTMNYRFAEPATSGGKLDPFWMPALVAAAPNTAISVVVPGAIGGASVSCNLVGFRL